MKNDREILALLHKVDQERGAQEKMKLIIEAVEAIEYISAAHIVWFSRASQTQTADPVSLIPYESEKLFPALPSILKDGALDLIRAAMKKLPPKSEYLFFPFPDRSEHRTGGLIVTSLAVKTVMQEMALTMELLGSKIVDILEIASLKQKIHRYSPVSTDIFSQKAPGVLMDYLNLPMYVTDRSGKFLYVNDVFLKHFQYAGIEDINKSADFFMEPDLRDREIKRLTGEGWVHRFNIRIRTGRGRILIVQDSATLQNQNITGVLFDITEFISINEELMGALNMQEELNDKLISSALILQKTQMAAIKSLAKLAEYRDRETGDHLQRICEYVGTLSKEVFAHQPFNFRVSEDYINDIYISSMLHDIGKVAVPDGILLKPQSLAPDEWDIMRQHTTWGWTILTQADKELGEQSFLTMASTIALHHHEWFDGTGYPHHLKGEDIPLSARIETIADVYDALTSPRPYKEAWSHDRAVSEILSLKGQQFDPVMVDIFLDVEKKIDNIRKAFPG